MGRSHVIRFSKTSKIPLQKAPMLCAWPFQVGALWNSGQNREKPEPPPEGLGMVISLSPYFTRFVPHPKRRFPVQLFGHSAEARHLSTRFAIARGYAKLNFTIRCVIQEPEEKAEEGCETGVHNYAGDGDIMICQECGDASLTGLFLARVYFGDILRVTNPFFVFCRTRGSVAGMS
jgi:hypothetical protein